MFAKGTKLRLRASQRSSHDCELPLPKQLVNASRTESQRFTRLPFVFTLKRIQTGVFFKEEENLSAISVPLCRESSVSRLPKALFRELNGRCSYRAWASCHQICPHRLLLERYRGMRPPRGHRVTPGEPHRPRELGTDLKVWLAFFRWQAQAGWLQCDEPRRDLTMKLPRDLRIGQTDNFRPSFGSRADTRGFREGRQGSREKPDHPVWWDNQRCYRFHPYWTRNLKYAP